MKNGNSKQWEPSISKKNEMVHSGPSFSLKINKQASELQNDLCKGIRDQWKQWEFKSKITDGELDHKRSFFFQKGEFFAIF